MLNTIFLQSPGGIDGSLWIGIILIFAIMYFLMIRPQAKKEKERKEMLGNLKKGDKILLNAGIYGTVANAKDGEEVVSIAISSDAKIKVNRSSIAQVLLPKPKEDKK
ncbi:MAG: preprotein translocase subunit YajC [Candidatus Marinimicrobia bacterium]|nr:preprotein translocase subunit YajC [Candidatus Neomarinimicrobiota bacterium]